MFFEEGVFNVGFLNEIRIFSDSVFRSHFRISKANFERTLNYLSLEMSNGHRPILCLEAKFLSVLWLLATPESYRAVSLRFGVSKTSLHYSFLRIVNTLCKLAPQIIKWPDNLRLYCYNNRVVQ